MASPYDNASQQRILRLLLLMAGHEVHGLAPKDLAQSLGVSSGSITRDLHNLRALGLTEDIPETGRVRLGPKVVQIAIAHMTALDRATTQLAGIKNRYSKEP